MNRLTRISMLCLLVVAACANSWQASAGPIIGGKEWYQPADLLGYSWNDFNAICGGGACNGLLAGSGPDLSGWTWASIDEVGDLFAASSPHPGGISSYQSPLFQPYTDFINDTGFVRTTDDALAISNGITAVYAFSSSLAPLPFNAYLGLAQLSVGFPGQPTGSLFSTDTPFSNSASSPYIGGWLYRDAEVPLPATLWLLAAGLIALRLSRVRIA